jgi:hypothetical protein
LIRGASFLHEVRVLRTVAEGWLKEASRENWAACFHQSGTLDGARMKTCGPTSFRVLTVS